LPSNVGKCCGQVNSACRPRHGPERPRRQRKAHLVDRLCNQASEAVQPKCRAHSDHEESPTRAWVSGSKASSTMSCLRWAATCCRADRLVQQQFKREQQMIGYVPRVGEKEVWGGHRQVA